MGLGGTPPVPGAPGRILMRMTVLTDAPRDVAAALGVSARPEDGGSLTPAEAWAWSELQPDARPHRAGPPGLDAKPDRAAWPGSIAWPGPIVVVAHAPQSQFVRLQDRIAAGSPVPDRLVAVALDGARFRGQRGRAWATLRGNLHVTVHLALDLPAAPVQAALAVLPAVATARAIERASDGRIRPGLKWVNDLLLSDRKLGGVLAATSVDAGRVRHLLLGIGLNVAALPDLPPTPRALPPTRLADADATFAGPDAWGRLLGPLLEEIDAGRDALLAGDGGALVDAYRQRAAFLGREVVIWPVEEDEAAHPIASGRVEALLPDLSLRIEGHDQPVRHGRMTLA